MRTTSSKFRRTALALVLALGAASLAAAGSRQAVPHSGGGGGGGHAPRASAPSQGGHGTAYRGAPSRGSVPARGTATRGVAPRGTANGVARYGYYNGGGYYGGGYPCWGGWYPWWGTGWYGGWGWGWGWGGYGYGYGYGYGPAYAPYGDVYVASGGDSGGESDDDYEPPRSGPAVVETAVSPAKADVTLDAEAVGFASDYNGRWDKLSITPGRHTIIFRAKGYRTLVIELTALPGATYVLRDALVSGEGEDRRTIEPPAAPARAEAAPPPAMGRLRVHVEPLDAAVYLDGAYLGVAGELARMHGALAVPTGSHTLDVTRPGYATVSRAIDVGGAEVATFALTLTAAP